MKKPHTNGDNQPMKEFSVSHLQETFFEEDEKKINHRYVRTIL